jgi:hypothetical protein
VGANPPRCPEDIIVVMTARPRRRLRIAAILLLVVATVGWLITPHTDSRLVGEWINLDPTGFAAWRQFNADGTQRYSSGSIDPTRPNSSSWSVRGKTLTFSQGSRPIGRPWSGSFRRWMYDVINSYRQGDGTEHYTILEVTPDTLRIESHSGAPIEEYRRKP